MKAISPTQLIKFLPADMDMALAFPLAFRNQSRFREAISEGWIKADLICIEDQKAYYIGWNKTFDGGLWINVAQTLPGNHGNFFALFDGCELLAASIAVTCGSARRGVGL